METSKTIPLGYKKKNNARLFILSAIVSLSLFFNLYGINWGLPAMWHPDEAPTIREIVIPMASKLDPNPHNFQKPSLYYYFLEAVLSPYYLCHKIFKLTLSPNLGFVGSITLISRIITAIIGTASVLLMYFIGSRFFNMSTGIIAAFFLASSMGFASHAHFAYMDIPMIFLMLIMILLSLQYLEKGQVTTLYLASFIGGLSISTKYNAALAVILTILFCHFDQLSIAFQKENGTKERIKALLPKSFIISLMLMTAGFVLGTPFSILDFPAFAATIVKQIFIANKGYKVSFGESHSWLANLSYLKLALGKPLLVLSLGGLFWGFISFFNKPNRKVSVLLFVPVVYFAYIGSWHISALRYVLLMIPFLVFWAAALIGELLKKTRTWKTLSIIAVVLIMAYSSFYTYRGVQCFSNDTRKISGKWISMNIDNGSTIETYSYVSYLPSFRKTLYVNRMKPNFIVESPSYEKFKEKIIKSPINSIVFKIFKRNIQIDDFSDQRDNRKEFTIDALKKRDPDFIVLSARFFDRFIEKHKVELSSDYPILTNYYSKLLKKEAGYKIISKFEDKTPTGEFVNPTIIVLKRDKIG